MIGAIHGLIGACIGSFCKNQASAFLCGVGSHVIADMLPHTDLDPRIEVPLATGALAAIAQIKGCESPEFWGAVGGMAPDLEHGLALTSIIDDNQKAFLTHMYNGEYHGPESGERLSQLAIAAAAVLIMALKRK